MQLSINTTIIIITVLVSLGGFNNRKIIDDLIFYPPAISRQNQVYRFFSCGLIHADFTHLLFNMIGLFFFGGFVENKFKEIFENGGQWVYLLLYVSALLVSLIPTYLKNKDNHYYRSLGASGAVSAVVFAGLMIKPDSEVSLIFLPFFAIPGFIFAPLYLILSFYLGRSGRDNINHSAHMFGALYGLFFVIIAGRLVGYDAIAEFIAGVQYYMRLKGWTS